MKIVITGATGLIGRAFAFRAADLGHQITALVRDPSGAKAKLPAGCELVQWDGLKSPPPPEKLKNCEAVVHLAGENVAAKRWNPARKKALRDSRVIAAAMLANGLEKAGVQPAVFVSASGIGIYGDRADEVLTEDSAPGNDFLARLCVKWETAADMMPAKRVVKLRFGAVLSPEGGFLAKVVPMFRRLGAAPLGSGRQWFSWVHIADVVQVLENSLMWPDYSGAFNVSAPGVVTNKELTLMLKEQIGAWPAPAAPAFALKILYGELAEALLGSQRAEPRRLLATGYQFKFPDLESALNSIEFSSCFR